MLCYSVKRLPHVVFLHRTYFLKPDRILQSKRLFFTLKIYFKNVFLTLGMNHCCVVQHLIKYALSRTALSQITSAVTNCSYNNVYGLFDV